VLNVFFLNVAGSFQNGIVKYRRKLLALQRKNHELNVRRYHNEMVTYVLNYKRAMGMDVEKELLENYTNNINKKDKNEIRQVKKIRKMVKEQYQRSLNYSMRDAIKRRNNFYMPPLSDDEEDLSSSSDTESVGEVEQKVTRSSKRVVCIFIRAFYFPLTFSRLGKEQERKVKTKEDQVPKSEKYRRGKRRNHQDLLCPHIFYSMLLRLFSFRMD